MSLSKIEDSIEKLALAVARSAMSTVGRSLANKTNLKSIGTTAAIGAGVGGVYNTVAGDSNEGIGTRFIKGAVGGALAGGGYQAGKIGLKAHAAANKGFRAAGAHSTFKAAPAAPVTAAAAPAAAATAPVKRKTTAKNIQNSSQTVVQRNFNARSGD